MNYPYTKTIHIISTEWSLTHLFLLYEIGSIKDTFSVYKLIPKNAQMITL